MNNLNIVVESPVKGQWAILNPPGHHDLAFDFLLVNDKKMPYRFQHLFLHLFLSIPVTATYTWTQPVYAPLDGEVIDSSDGNPDRERISMIRDLIRLMLSRPKPGAPFCSFGGNYIILKCGNIYPLLAHLKMDSLQVRIGDFVQTGQQLGEVGNSGSSIQPLFQNLLPFKLHTVQKRVGQVWDKQEDAELKKGDHLHL